MKRIGALALGGAALTVVMAMTGCAPSAGEAPDEVAVAVRESSPAIDGVTIEPGVDGLSRYLLVRLELSTEELPPADLERALRALGDTVPDSFDSVQLLARSASDERLDLAEPLAATGLDGYFMINERRASIPVEALQAFATR